MVDTAGKPSSRLQLRDGWLLAGRLAWLIISLAAVTILVYGLAVNATGWWQADPSGADCPPEALQACLTQTQADNELGLTTRAAAVFYTLGAGLELLPWVLVGGLIFWRRSQYLFELAFSLLLVLIGSVGIDRVTVIIAQRDFPALAGPIHFLEVLTGALLGLWFLFPSGHFVPRWSRWLAIVWAAAQTLSFLFPTSRLDVFAMPSPWPQIINALFILALVAALVYRYRRVSGPGEKQQIKWVVASALLFGAVYVLGKFLDPPVGLPTTIYHLTYSPTLYISSALLAASFGVALLRYRLWDIDIILRRGLTYGFLTLSLALVYFVSVLLLQGAASRLMGESSALSIVVSTLLIAALFNPLRKGFQRLIDRRFFRQRYDAEKVLTEFGQNLRREVNIDQLQSHLTSVITETLQPEQVSLWLKPARQKQARPRK